MQREYLAREIIGTFEQVNTGTMLARLKLTIKGENAILMLLNNFSGRSTPSELMNHLDFTAARLSAIIKSLESKGFVERQKNEKDKRSTIVVLTEKGREQFRILQQETVDNALDIIEKLGEDDVVELLRIFRRVVAITNSEQ